MISGDKEVIEAVKLKFAQISGKPVRVSERSNLDGSASTWVLAATIAVQMLPVILTFIKDYAASKRVKKIKVGDIEIENPDDALIEAMKTKLANG
jgi:hypothetical protein